MLNELLHVLILINDNFIFKFNQKKKMCFIGEYLNK